METTTDNSALWASLLNQKDSPAEMMAMMNGGANNWNNSPWMYLIFLALFGGGGFGFGGNRADAAQNADLSRQLQTLQNQVADNNSNSIALAAINGNRDALGQLAQTFNTDLGSISSAIANVQSAIQQVGGQVGFSAESVKNAIALGDASITSKMQECCCSNKLLTQQMGYEAQLRDQANTAALTSRIDQLANGITQGFAQVGYATQAQTSEIIQAGNANTQKILDAMCQNTTQSLRDAIADKDRQLQTQTLLNQLGSSCGCNS